LLAALAAAAAGSSPAGGAVPFVRQADDNLIAIA